MKKYTFSIGQLLTLIALLAMEFAPNKYLANAFILIKGFVAFQAVVFASLVGMFASRLPSPSTVNLAIELTKQEKKSVWKRAYTFVWRLIPVSITVTALLFGQWFVFTMFLVFLVCMFAVRPTAEKYLRYVKVDTDKKTAIIDV